MDAQAEEANVYPLRNGGPCKLDMNHPGPRTNQAWGLKADPEEQRNPGNAAGYTASGSSNRYETDIAVPQLNLLGLPIRLGEKECTYYKHKGYCGYGARCVYHHPDRTLMKSDNFAPWGAPLPQPQPYQGHWYSHPSSYNNLVYQNESSSYHVNTDPLPLERKRHSAWIGYQAPKLIPHLKRETKGADTRVDQGQLTIKAEELPPVCGYLLKTGDCNFKSACRYHHPSDWVCRREERVLSEHGLPLKPGKEVCPDYRNFGLCISGPVCPFDHPVALKFPPTEHRCSTADKGKGTK